jgi:hypothetical protein
LSTFLLAMNPPGLQMRAPEWALAVAAAG